MVPLDHAGRATHTRVASWSPGPSYCGEKLASGWKSRVLDVRISWVSQSMRNRLEVGAFPGRVLECVPGCHLSGSSGTVDESAERAVFQFQWVRGIQPGELPVVGQGAKGCLDRGSVQLEFE